MSYQVPDDEPPLPPPVDRPPDVDAIATRRRDATRSLVVDLSPDQRRWVRGVAKAASDPSGDAVVRALVDLGMALEVDWGTLDGPRAIRAAVRDGVLIRRRMD